MGFRIDGFRFGFVTSVAGQVRDRIDGLRSAEMLAAIEANRLRERAETAEENCRRATEAEQTMEQRMTGRVTNCERETRELMHRNEVCAMSVPKP